MSAIKINPRYSGHETFACRYAWLPKIIAELMAPGGKKLFSDENDAMVHLGVGKNMVRSAKFWAEATQIIEECDGGFRPSQFGNQLIGPEGWDPFLERPETLWLIHWKIATHSTRPLFHWQQMLNYWHRSEFTESELLPFLEHALPKDKEKTSKRTLADGLRVFINSYVPTRGKKGEIAEDNLDCPLAELGLIHIAGERLNQLNQRETIYSYNLDEKPSISPELFAYCLFDFWTSNEKFSEEKSLSARVVCSEAGSPGQIFKLQEREVNTLLDTVSTATGHSMVFEESQTLQQIWRKKPITEEALLDSIYDSAL